MRARGIAILCAALCLLGAVSAAAARDPAARAWPAWPGTVACGTAAPAFSPPLALSRPADAEKGSLPAEVALREWLREKRQPGPGRHGWRLLGVNDEAAEFIHGNIGAKSSEQIAFLRTGDKWQAAYKVDGSCEFLARRGHRVATGWRLTPGQRLTVSSRSVKVSLEATECASGIKATSRLEAPRFRVENGALLLTLWLRPLPPGGYTCQAPFEAPVKIRLPQRLGPLKLLDGGVFPPRPAG